MFSTRTRTKFLLSHHITSSVAAKRNIITVHVYHPNITVLNTHINNSVFVWHMFYLAKLCRKHLYSIYHGSIFFLLSALVSFNLWRRFGFLFAWLQTMIGYGPSQPIKTTRKNWAKATQIGFFFFLWKWIISEAFIYFGNRWYTHRKNNIKIPENGRHATFLPPSYQLCSIYSVRWFLFSFVPFSVLFFQKKL